MISPSCDACIWSKRETEFTYDVQTGAFNSSDTLYCRFYPKPWRAVAPEFHCGEYLGAETSKGWSVWDWLNK